MADIALCDHSRIVGLPTAAPRARSGKPFWLRKSLAVGVRSLRRGLYRVPLFLCPGIKRCPAIG